MRTDFSTTIWPYTTGIVVLLCFAYACYGYEKYMIAMVILGLLIGILLLLLTTIYRQIIFKPDRLEITHFTGRPEAIIYYDEILTVKSKLRNTFDAFTGVDGTVKTIEIVMKNGDSFFINNGTIDNITEFVGVLNECIAASGK